MFKVIIITNDEIKYHHSSLNRQIVSENRDEVMFSPETSPKKGEIQMKLKSTKNIQNINNEFKVTQIIGELKLFHLYQLQKSQESMPQTLIQQKRQQATILAHLKTNTIGILNIKTIQQKQKILSQLRQIQNQVQYIDIIYSPYTNKQPKQPQIQLLHMIVYFKNSLFSEEFYKISFKDFELLPVYIKQVVITKTNKQQQLTYHQIVNFFKYNQMTISMESNKQPQNYQSRWIQLPKCPKCLLKLQFEVSGIQDKILFLVSEKNKSSLDCHTCKIIELHQKNVQNNRKVSYQEGYKDHTTQKHTHCDDCKQKSDIWICMVCSRVGCGRYKNADAYKHFQKSGHAITIDLETQRVWNYLSDCFSHKLLKTISELNVKFSELRNQQGQNIEQLTLEAAFWEYCSIFSEQMQRQRVFYENIKNSETQKFDNQVSTLDKFIENLIKQRQDKHNQLKKTIKQKNKCIKKQKQIIEKIQTQRQLLKDYQQNLSNKNTTANIQKDEDILEKKKQLQELQKEMNQILIKLSTVL